MAINFEIIVVTLASISIFFTSLLLVLSIFIKEMHKHPGILVIIQCFLQVIYDLHWILLGNIGM